MTSDSTAVRFRLSRSQMSHIWPGLDLILNGHSSNRTGKNSRFCYPFRLNPPAPGFNRGEYSADLMSRVIELSRRLRPKAFTGGRVQMDTIEIRAAIFAVRVNLDWRRYQIARARKTLKDRRVVEKTTPRNRVKTTRAERHVDRAKESLQDALDAYCHLKNGAPRVINTLERHLKRANSRLMAEVERAEFNTYMQTWRAHLRWMRLRLVYFWLPRIGPIRRKSDYQVILQELERIARLALAEEGYAPPEANELHRIMRLFTVSVRRGRQGSIKGIPRALRDGLLVRSAMVDFVVKRTAMKRVPEE